ncbi:kallikrein-7-like [Culicoides brevitarsis]|uniref:kallikrein-7-like n=1 Tax=Culicoides brevitarsis TaxID=469753 RepID=UPI00307C98D6
MKIFTVVIFSSIRLEVESSSFKETFRMTTFFIFWLLFGTSFALRRIINGHYAKEGQFPFFAEVINFQTNDRIVTCGGALVSPRKVVTVAHCLEESLGIVVRLGSTKKHQGNPFGVEKQVQYPNMDFVVLILDRPVQDEGEIIQIMERPVIPGEKCTAIGFGFDGKNYSEDMKFVSLTIDDPKDVQKLVSFPLSKMEIFAGMKDNSDVCFGDSGGPLLCNEGLAGITLGSLLREPCNSQGLPSKFANLHQLQQWIDAIQV